jgi:hypothetical protein
MCRRAKKIGAFDPAKVRAVSISSLEAYLKDFSGH